MMAVLGVVAAAVTWDGVNEHEEPEGRPEQVSLTMPLNPKVGAMLSMVETDEPLVTVRELAAELKPYVGVPVLVSLEMAAKSPWTSPVSPAVK